MKKVDVFLSKETSVMAEGLLKETKSKYPFRRVWAKYCLYKLLKRVVFTYEGKHESALSSWKAIHCLSVARALSVVTDFWFVTEASRRRFTFCAYAFVCHGRKVARLTDIAVQISLRICLLGIVLKNKTFGPKSEMLHDQVHELRDLIWRLNTSCERAEAFEYLASICSQYHLNSEAKSFRSIASSARDNAPI